MRSAVLFVSAWLGALSLWACIDNSDCTRTATCERATTTTGAGGSGATGGTTAASGGGGASASSGGGGGAPASYVATAVTAGELHSCALIDDGRVACWGDNEQGQLGDGTFSASLTPVLVDGLTDVVELAAGERHTCALRANGSVWCWGDGTFAQIGQVGDAGTPLQVAGVTNVGSIAAGANHTCSHTNGGGAICWGASLSAQLGHGITTSYALPVNVANLMVVTDLAAATDYSCAIADTATVICWGLAPDVVDSTTPQAMYFVGSPGPPLTGSDLAVADDFACALRTDKPWCWGQNGQTMASEVDLPNVVELAGGGGHICARLQTSALHCWGDNSAGQLGTGTSGGEQALPTLVDGISGVSTIGLGTSHTCAVAAAGAVYCWGDNTAGQLGDGTMAGSAMPVAVGAFP